MKTASKQKAMKINIRVDVELKNRLQRLAQKFGTEESQLARLLIERYVEDCEAAGYLVVYPPQFKRFHISEDKLSIDE